MIDIITYLIRTLLLASVGEISEDTDWTFMPEITRG